ISASTCSSSSSTHDPCLIRFAYRQACVRKAPLEPLEGLWRRLGESEDANATGMKAARGYVTDHAHASDDAQVRSHSRRKAKWHDTAERLLRRSAERGSERGGGEERRDEDLRQNLDGRSD